MSEAFSQQYFVALNSHHLVKQFGSLTAASIFSRAEYWFSRKVDQFYKFIEPCAHPCYRPGDSWCEELGISRKAFRKAFERIGVRYLSKTQFDQEKDPFKGKFFAYYFDRKANKTIFVRNHQAVEDFIKGLRASLNLTPKETPAALPSQPKPDRRAGAGRDPEKGEAFQDQSRNGHVVHSYAHAYKDNKYKTSFSQKEISKKDSRQEETSDASQVASHMKEIWVEEIGDKDLPPMSRSLMRRLSQAFLQFFQKSFDRWRLYCRKIASSKFLMGEGRVFSGFRAWIQWAITQDAIERIESGEFKADRTPPKVLKQNAELSRIRYERDSVKQLLDGLKFEFDRKWMKETRQKMEEASRAQKETWEHGFLEHLEETNPMYAAEFRVEKWNALCSETLYMGYVSSLLFGEIETNKDYLERKERLEQKLHQLNERLFSGKSVA